MQGLPLFYNHNKVHNQCKEQYSENGRSDFEEV